jgi:hypothetical protein
VIGATKSYGLKAEEAMQMCYHPNTLMEEEETTCLDYPEGAGSNSMCLMDPAILATSSTQTRQLLEASVRVWPPLLNWKVSEIR